jgi:hypothetical protein
MRVLCRILIAVTLVVHLTAGCCAHHAHACEGTLRSPHGHTTYDGPCLSSDSDHLHHGTNDCEGERCSFVSPSRAVSDSLAFSFQTFFTPLLDDQLSPVGFGCEEMPFASGRLLLPVRLHLANQVLLI